MIQKIDITADDIIITKNYEKERIAKRSEVGIIKAKRRLPVGPHAMFNFECYDTIWYQIQEMVRIEKGGDEQILEEIEAYNPLIPKGNELISTLMFEIPNPEQRAQILKTLGGVENTIYMEVGDEVIFAEPESEIDRTNSEGKTSAVHFIRFTMNPNQQSLFKMGQLPVGVGIKHENYRHLAFMPENMRVELSRDLF